MTRANDQCPDRGCRGTMLNHDLGYSLDPLPSSTLECNACKRVLLVVTEPDRPRLELWHDYQGYDEPFREQVERAHQGDKGPADAGPL